MCAAGMRRMASFGPTRMKAAMDTTRLSGRPAALVERPCRHVWLVVSGRGAVARRGREPAASRGDGPGDDLLDAAELLLQRRHLGPLVGAVDLDEHRGRCARETGPARSDEPATMCPRWNAVKEKMLGTLPLDQLEELRDIAPYYYDWLHHPPDDPFWNFAELRNKYGRTRAAVLNLSGWHDDNYGPEGAITNYLGLVAVAPRQPVHTPRSCSVPGSTASTRPLGRSSANASSVPPPQSTTTRSSSGGWIAICGTIAASRPIDAACGISSWATTSGGRRTRGRRAGATASTICLPAGETPGRGALRSTPPAGTRFGEHICVRSGRSRDQSVRVGRRARLPGTRQAQRRADVRFGASRLGTPK